jgi:predicted peptidase
MRKESIKQIRVCALKKVGEQMNHIVAAAVVLSVVSIARGQDYPKVPPERAEVILSMRAGAVKDFLKLPRGSIDFPWRLHVPDPLVEGVKYPLVVFLHGAGRRGDDNVGPMELAWDFIKPEAQEKYPCFIVAGQVPRGRTWSPFGPARQKFRDAGKDVPITEEMTAMLSVVDDLLEKEPIDPTRLYVVGQSMGGYGTWDALERRPDLWAAAVPICGGGSPQKAHLFEDVPIWAWHGEKDQAVPPQESRDMIEALRAAGGNPKYSELPNVGHGSWSVAFSDPALFEWLFSQKK